MTQPKLNRQGLMAALCATATWGMAGVFVRWLPGWPPFAVLAGRFLVATAAMLPVFFLASIRHDFTLSLRNLLIWWLSLPAIASYVLGTTAFQMAPVGEVTLLFTTSPLFIIAYKYVVRLPVKRSESIGTLLATAGVSLIMLPQLSTDQAASWQTMAGYLLALGAAGLLLIRCFAIFVLHSGGAAFANRIGNCNIVARANVCRVICIGSFTRDSVTLVWHWQCANSLGITVDC